MSGGVPRVLGAGLVALDLVVSPDAHVPIQAWAGGTCGNVLAILAWHGWDALPIARMNGDSASERVRSDLERFGVNMSLADCAPVTNTPIVVQEIRRNRSGAATHRFSWACLQCGGWLPSFKPVTRDVVERVQPFIADSSAFFFDRVSRGTLELAREAATAGAVVMFEPSGRGDDKMFNEALELAHIVKYADQRMANLTDEGPSENRVLEIQTLGAEGLRFRMPQRKRADGWRLMKAAPAETVVDACGSGDWCSAGLLSHVASNGVDGLRGLTVKAATDALRYGQELAAWNCGFEGARGGMYQDVDMRFVPRIGHLASIRPGRGEPTTSPLIQCPKCDVA